MPAATDFVVTMVRVGFPSPLIVLEVKLAVAPLGRPLTLSCTVPPKPSCGATLAVTLVLAPAVTLAAAGVTPRVKLGVRVFWLPLLNPEQPLRHSRNAITAAPLTNLGDLIGWLLPDSDGYTSAAALDMRTFTHGPEPGNVPKVSEEEAKGRG